MDMKSVQTQLRAKGYRVGKVDGIGGPATARAVQEMLKDQGFDFAVSATPKKITAVTPVGGQKKSKKQKVSAPALVGFTKREALELAPVHPDLIKVITRAKETCPEKFGVFDGIRTAQDQNALFRRKASQKDGYRNKSTHQMQATGYSHAADLVPLVNGEWDWDWDILYVIAEHMHDAAVELDVQIRWGGCWKHINPLKGSPENWVAEYVKRKLAANKRAFNDGPHYELYGY
jgi:peptidoglycan L-alanyl-D-glutamate endopeptidase CwlK